MHKMAAIYEISGMNDYFRNDRSRSFSHSVSVIHFSTDSVLIPLYIDTRHTSQSRSRVPHTDSLSSQQAVKMNLEDHDEVSQDSIQSLCVWYIRSGHQADESLIFVPKFHMSQPPPFMSTRSLRLLWFDV